MISDADKERVREATDFVSLVAETVVLRQRGANDFWGCCPFHQEKSPSFHVKSDTGLWHCFGCGTGGDVFDYTMRREKLEFTDAIRYLAERAHIEIEETQQRGPKGPKRGRLIEALEAAEDSFSLRLMRGRSEGAAEARKYFASRGFNSGICSRWKLGYADGSVSLVRELQQAGFSRDELVSADIASVRNGSLRDHFFNRVMFPIHDEQGHCIGFGGRVMGDAKPKYLNTRETPVFHKSKHMFAFDKAKESIASQGFAIVTEGYMDVISMHEAGFTNTVAALGTALSLDHIKLLSRFAKTIICMFDGDAAGQHAAEAAVRYIESTNAALTCVVLPDNQDPDEFLKAHGSEAMKAQLDAAQPLLDFVVDKKLEDADLSSPGLRLKALDEVAKILAPLKNSYLLDSYAQVVASRLGTSLEATKDKIKAAPLERLEDNSRTNSSASYVADQPSYGEYDVAPEAYQDASVPATDFANAASQERTLNLATLTPEERTQIKAELNLLTLLADNPDAFRPYADRIAGLNWADERYQTIAWAILATPAGTTPAQAVVAATRACPDAPRFLSSGAFATTSSWDTSKNIEFVVGEAEIRSLDRQIAQLTARLSASSDSTEARDCLQKLSELRKQRKDLRAKQPAK